MNFVFDKFKSIIYSQNPPELCGILVDTLFEFFLFPKDFYNNDNKKDKILLLL